MSLFSRGIVFDFSKYVNSYDITKTFVDIDQHKLLVQTIKFVTEGIYDELEGSEQLSEMEYFMGKLYDERIIPDYLFSEPDCYLKTYGFVFAICSSVVSLLTQYRFYDPRHKSTFDPQVIRVNKKHFAIVL